MKIAVVLLASVLLPFALFYKGMGLALDLTIEISDKAFRKVEGWTK